MTTYSLRGFVTHFSANGQVTGVDQTTLEIVDLDTTTSNLSYQFTTNPVDPVNLPVVSLGISDLQSLRIPSVATLRASAGVFGEYKLGEIHWSGQTSYTFQYKFERDTADIYTFHLGGVPLPSITTAAQVAAFNSQVTAGNPAPTGSGFAPFDVIDVSELPNVTFTEDDEITAADGDNLNAGLGDDLFHYYGNTATLDGDQGSDTLVIERETRFEITDLQLVLGGISMGFFLPQFDSVTAKSIETFVFEDGAEYSFNDLRKAASNTEIFRAGTDTSDTLTGDNNDDRLLGNGGGDTLYGMDGTDTLNGGAGNDALFGGNSSDDLRDTIYGVDGDDSIDGGYGNDLLYGMEDNDWIEGGFGSDTIFGGRGDDVLNGGALSDLLWGINGNNFFNGGFGFDRLNGGAGSDRFYHLGIENHVTDWVANYANAPKTAIEPAITDTLFFGQSGAKASDFHVNFATTPGAGSAVHDEAFVTYLPTGQIIWALVDGAQVDEIYLQISGSPELYDLLA